MECRAALSATGRLLAAASFSSARRAATKVSRSDCCTTQCLATGVGLSPLASSSTMRCAAAAGRGSRAALAESKAGAGGGLEDGAS